MCIRDRCYGSFMLTLSSPISNWGNDFGRYKTLSRWTQETVYVLIENMLVRAKLHSGSWKLLVEEESFSSDISSIPDVETKSHALNKLPGRKNYWKIRVIQQVKQFQDESFHTNSFWGGIQGFSDVTDKKRHKILQNLEMSYFWHFIISTFFFFVLWPCAQSVLR